MPRLLSGFIPLTATSLAFAAFMLPAWFVQDHLRRSAPPDLSAIPDAVLLTLLAAVALAYLGSVRWRDLERLENAWAITTRLGRRSMPADRLRASARWAMGALFKERYWGRALNAAAAGLRWTTPALAVASLTAAAACAVLAGLGALAPQAAAQLAVAPGWSDALLLALPALLWPVVRMHLPRLAHAEVPSEEQINHAHVELMDRLTDPKVQAGSAAMTAVDRGLDGVFALARRAGAVMPSMGQRPPHELQGLSEVPRELVDACDDR